MASFATKVSAKIPVASLQMRLTKLNYYKIGNYTSLPVIAWPA